MALYSWKQHTNKLLLRDASIEMKSPNFDAVVRNIRVKPKATLVVLKGSSPTHALVMSAEGGRSVSSIQRGRRTYSLSDGSGGVTFAMVPWIVSSQTSNLIVWLPLIALKASTSIAVSFSKTNDAFGLSRVDWCSICSMRLNNSLW